MSKKGMKTLGIICLIICLTCVFVAFERYTDNAKKVRALNERPSIPFMDRPVKPATPVITKYAIFFSVISGVSGAVLLFKSAD